jgi:hypothetical protein
MKELPEKIPQTIKEQQTLFSTAAKSRSELFDCQNEIQRKRDGLIDELERQLKQKNNRQHSAGV